MRKLLHLVIMVFAIIITSCASKQNGRITKSPDYLILNKYNKSKTDTKVTPPDKDSIRRTNFHASSSPHATHSSHAAHSSHASHYSAK